MENSFDDNDDLLDDLLWPHHLLKNLNISKSFYSKIGMTIFVILFAHKIDFQMKKDRFIFYFPCNDPICLIQVSWFWICQWRRLKSNKTIRKIRKLLDLSLTTKTFSATSIIFSLIPENFKSSYLFLLFPNCFPNNWYLICSYFVLFFLFYICFMERSSGKIYLNSKPERTECL